VTRKPPTALLASLAIHLCVFALLFLLAGPRFPESSDRRVVVQFATAPQSPPEPSRTGVSRTPELPRVSPAALGDSLRLEGPRTLSLPPGSTVLAIPPARAAATRQETLQPSRPLIPDRPAAAVALAALPSAQEILALEGPAIEPATAAAGTAGPARSASAAERGFLEAPALEWRGRQRTLVASGSLAFPEILLREGRDVEVEAVFSVAPSGQVESVEIVRSSGYAAVDREVEKALLGYLFEPAPEGSEDTGRVQFRFRLERDR
jgi:protein TonB